jgi:hypothetical protein
MRNRQRARCTRCGHIAPLRAFEVEVALSADDSGDNDWVINFACPACEAADRPQVLAEAPADGAPSRQAPGHSANPMYDPRMP